MSKVSIVSPCYNGERFIARFLEAILKQTYSNIQLIVVDDGSTDNTLAIMQSYQAAFEKRGYEYHVVHQENGGQAKAINTGLMLVDGEYFAWPDSDDFLFPESVAKRVEFLQQNAEYGMVLSNGNEYADEDLRLLKSSVVRCDQAENLLNSVLDMTAMFNNNGYLVRTNLLFSAYPNKCIYESRAGQNIQILLPLAAMSKCGYISEALYGRTIRADSHSKQVKNMEQRMDSIDDIYYHTILSMKADRAWFLMQYLSQRVYSSIVYYQSENPQKAQTYYKKLKQTIKILKRNQRKIRLHKIREFLTRRKAK